MGKQKSIGQNFLFNAILNASKFLFPLITYPYVARVLLPEGTGKVSFATSLIYYFIMFAELGIPKYGIRKCAMVREDKEELTRTVHELLMIQSITTAISYIALFGCIFMIPKLAQEKLLYFIISVGLLFHLIGVEWLYKALEEYRYISIRSMAFKVISVIAMFLFVKERNDYIVYGAITIIASSASYIFNFIRARKIISFRPVGNYNLRQHIKPVLVFFAMACAVSIYSHIDTLMLGFLNGDVEVGYYNAAVKVKTILVSVLTSLSLVLLPRASYYLTKGKVEEFENISRKSMSFSALLSAPLVVFFITYAQEAVNFLAGTSYQPAVLPMQMIMPSLFMIAMSYPLGIQILVPLGKEQVVLYSEIAGAVVNVIVNILLIPRVGAAGAAVSNVCAEFTVLAVQFAAVRKEMSTLMRDICWWKILVSVTVGIIPTMWIKSLDMSAFWMLAFSGVSFFAVYGTSLMLLKEKMVMDTVLHFMKTLIRKGKKDGQNKQ